MSNLAGSVKTPFRAAVTTTLSALTPEENERAEAAAVATAQRVKNISAAFVGPGPLARKRLFYYEGMVGTIVPPHEPILLKQPFPASN